MTRAEAIGGFPTIFSNKKTVDELDNWNRPEHLSRALVGIKDQRGKGQYTDEKIDDTIARLEKGLGGVGAAVPSISGPCTLRAGGRPKKLPTRVARLFSKSRQTQSLPNPAACRTAVTCRATAG
jgi:hypothetical protein